MANPESLTLAFVGAHPAEAARILERIHAVDAAALFERVPARAGAPVLTAMLPSAAARVLAALEAGTAQSLLVNSGTQAAVTILRQISEPLRSQLVEGLPTTAAIASSRACAAQVWPCGDQWASWRQWASEIFPPLPAI